MSRKVLVTAGASGIGKHIAAAFLAAGDDVYTCDLNADALKSAAAELKGLKTGVCNVGDRGQVQRMVAEAAAMLGGIDVLVNNAGIAGPTAPVQDVDPDEWARVLQIRPHRHVQRDEECDTAPHSLRQRRNHHHVLGRRPLRISEPKPVFHREVGTDRVHEDSLDGARRAQHTR